MCTLKKKSEWNYYTAKYEINRFTDHGVNLHYLIENDSQRVQFSGIFAKT